MKTKFKTGLFALSLLLGAVSAQAACNGCAPIGVGVGDDDFDDPYATYSAVVKQYIWYTNSSGQRTGYWNYTTLTGTTMAYCQQQLSAVLGSPGTMLVQFCEKD